MDIDFDKAIEPFFWVQHSDSVSMCLNVGSYKEDLFKIRAGEGFEGSGYDWTSLAKVFIDENAPELKDIIRFDPEGSMFCAYSSNEEALKKFATLFKQACEEDSGIQSLFLKAELD